MYLANKFSSILFSMYISEYNDQTSRAKLITICKHARPKIASVHRDQFSSQVTRHQFADTFAEAMTKIENQCVCISSFSPSLLRSLGASLAFYCASDPQRSSRGAQQVHRAAWRFTESGNPYNRGLTADLRRNSRFSPRRGMPILGALARCSEP